MFVADPIYRVEGASTNDIQFAKRLFASKTLPGKVQSCMATGNPIIAAADGETKKIIENAKCGYCVPAEDYKALANKMIEFASKTKVEIADEMKNTSDSLSAIIDSWSDDTNPLYDTLLIKVKDTEKISKTADQVNELELVKEVKYGQGMVESLLSVFKVLEKAMIIAMVALVFVTLFLITNTIKISISNIFSPQFYSTLFIIFYFI